MVNLEWTEARFSFLAKKGMDFDKGLFMSWSLLSALSSKMFSDPRPCHLKSPSDKEGVVESRFTKHMFIILYICRHFTALSFSSDRFAVAAMQVK